MILWSDLCAGQAEEWQKPGRKVEWEEVGVLFVGFAASWKTLIAALAVSSCDVAFESHPLDN